MLIGAHVILHSRDAESDREFFRDVLKFPAVDAGRGWLLLKFPVAKPRFIPLRIMIGTSCISCATTCKTNSSC
jgi:hypothetical protein